MIIFVFGKCIRETGYGIRIKTLKTISQIPDADYTAIEVFNPANAKDYAKYPVISDSDAHYLDDVAKKQLYIDVEEKSFAALRDSLQKNRIVLK